MEQLCTNIERHPTETALPEHRQEPSYDRAATAIGALAAQAQITVHPLPEYEPPLVFEPSTELPELPSSRDFPDLPKSQAFQLALDLAWARKHRIIKPEQRIAPADLQATRWFLSAMVEVLNRRRPLIQLQHQLDSRVFAGLETRLRSPPSSSHAIHLRSVHACQPVKRVIEACGVFEQGNRTRALVARLEGKKRRWLCTVLRIV
jgi:hypothetical protein